ncbi:LOW QUALITY PROTEIN: uncharacterized protein LOC117490940 [Trematomus bernacchii]|uniref:LOW QUALITY PROTEIN: uncharacterized protein LOC117490940 n=1 Tax=Trematomus bernacchii TaxID=40690 RepID=UPI00146B75E1|nr:LOW QUALITY PROTEIN: uncharacterized protein LOC117490940 [Trematomus bernacchii]
MSYDQHTVCESCLGSEHAYAALSQQVACTHCARLPSDDRKRRADALAAAAEEDDWPVQVFEPVDGSLMSLEPSAGQESDDSYPVEGFTDAGFPATPSLEPGLTAFFGVRQANMIAGRRPTLASPRDQYVARQADRVHQCAFQALAAANNIALLSNSVVTLVERSTTLAADEAEEIGKAASTALTLRVCRCLPGKDRRVGDADPAPPLAAAGVCYRDGQQAGSSLLGGHSGTYARSSRSVQPGHSGRRRGILSNRSVSARRRRQGLHPASPLPRHPRDEGAELRELLLKEAISRVPQGEENQGYYSRYFLVPKKTGGMRPILDLSVFNKVIMKRPFHMLTIRQVLECVHQGDWFTSIDLKDAYFHVAIIPKHRKYLRFSFQGISYQYNRLPFGYSLAPRTFSKCVETALQPLHRGGMRVLFYLDDLLLLARSREEVALQTVQLVSHLSKLGFIINWKKSCPLPSQSIIYLGVELNSARMRARLSQQRVEALTALLRCVTPRSVVTALSMMQLLGMMAAGHVVIPLGLLHMRRLQRWFIRLRIDPVRQKRRMVAIPPSVGSDLTYWKSPHVLSAGVPLGRVTSHISVFTDASLSGWGGTCMSQAVGGQWPAHMSLHINVLELLSVRRVIQYFAPLLRNQHVLIRTDNKAGAAYINRQGGVRSAQLLNTARPLLICARAHLLSIRAMYVPGELNKGADLMSRGGPRQGDWSLHPELVSQVWSRFGRAEVDLFAARGNAQCALWFSLKAQDHPPLGVDAFAHRPWPRGLLYAFPPVPLIPRFLDRVQEERLSVILIAPEHTGASWFPCLQRTLSGRPWEIPWRGDALSQVEGAINSHPVIGQHLWAWPLNGNT